MIVMPSSSSSALIDRLVDDLAPVRRLDARTGLLNAGLMALATIGLCALIFGLRFDMMAGRPDPVFMLASGLIFVLALASTVALIGMSRPGVGQAHRGWIWAAVGVGLLPLGAVLSLIIAGSGEEMVSGAARGADCMMKATGLGLGFALVHIFTLRKGAPTSPERAGWLVGVTAGSLGSFAYGLHCPVNDLIHLGLWHVLPIVLSAALARALVPPLIRW
jgi:hypothetical protein